MLEETSRLKLNVRDKVKFHDFEIVRSNIYLVLLGMFYLLSGLIFVA